MGAGLAKSLRDKYPVVYSEYKKLYDSTNVLSNDTRNLRYNKYIKRDLLGVLQDIKLSDNLHVYNSFSQADIGYNGLFTDENLLINNLIKAI